MFNTIFYNYFLILLCLLLNELQSQSAYNHLTPKEKEIIIYKGTEIPFSGKYNNHFKNGIYICKQCNQELYNSDDKFVSNCGWPSFDNSIEGLRLVNKSVFSVQYHPEANPGPQDSKYLFNEFIKEVKKYAKKKRH